MARVVIDTGDGTFMIDGEAVSATEVILTWHPGKGATIKYVPAGQARSTRATQVDAWVNGDAEITEQTTKRKKK